MSTNGRSVGIVKNERFVILGGPTGASLPVRLTEYPIFAGALPEGKEIDLSPYEGKAIMVAGRLEGGWIWSAEIVDAAGPILSAVVEKLFGDG